MNNRINLILVLFVIVAFLVILYVKKLEHFENKSTSSVFVAPLEKKIEPVTFTYNTDMTNVVKIIDNINVDGRYLNVFECQPITASNGDVYKPLGQYMKITDKNLANISEDEKKIVCLNLLVKGGVQAVDYIMIWSSQYLKKPPQQDFSIWRPIAPFGYKHMCDIIIPGFSKPSSTNSIICIPESVVENSPILKDILLNIDYNAINMNYILHCWNTSSHNFFRCNNEIKDNKATPSPDPSNPLITDKKFLLENIFNIKAENIKAMGSQPTRIKLSSS